MIKHQKQILLVLTIILFSSCAKKNFFATTPIAEQSVYQTIKDKSPAEVDSVVVQAGKHYKRSGIHNLFWGKHYSDTWKAPVKVEVFDMNRTKGGLKVEKIGGGMQTTSFTLESKDGFPYALRSIDKDPVGVLPDFWQKTFVGNIVRYQTSAVNPYAALVLPVLAESVGIPHSTPTLVYVMPNDTTFGTHSEEVQDKLFMIEEKYTDDRAITPELGSAEDIVSSKKMLKKRFGKNSHHIDQRAFAKARLFDVFVGDWDRHEDQWEWIEYKENGETVYRPIPKDRDNAFFQFDDGLITWILSRKWAIRKFHSFSKEYKDVEALMVNSDFIDYRALSEVTAAEYQALAQELQQALTDEVLERAVRQYPDSVYKLIGASTLAKLKNRRDKLQEAADVFYRVMARNVLVVGTDDEEVFKVERLNDEETSVTVLRNSDNKQLYHRIFNRHDTKQISLYGLAEDDEFTITGDVNKGIEVVIIGGRGEDEITDKSSVKGWSKKTIVYDTKRGTELETSKETKDKRTPDVRVHAFDREGFN
ncbi:hypothetical protein [Pontibacter sp. SGAir0037]|uniref:hypothetical protein n=1 Tax=Pontibacter sp. SGAir0037 TaxID=2571030 RepID=UPI0010CCD2A4|nr:hypothetical protein [Pontibacter sp. SGAir0037]QCR23299.1 hypothetical protein C1N53_13760 [Pontibacter sp. SGAir0037]